MTATSSDIRFPAMLISATGWHKTADDPGELLDASPDDELSDWHRVEILDASGRLFIASRAFRGYPKSALGALLCRVVGHCIYVEFEFASVEHMSLGDFVNRVREYESLPPDAEWDSFEEVMNYVCD